MTEKIKEFLLETAEKLEEENIGVILASDHGRITSAISPTCGMR